MSASLSFEGYCSTRVAGNAATAYLQLGRPDLVVQIATGALRVFDDEGLAGPQALTRLDLAAALLGAEPERAERLVRESLAIASTARFNPVLQRVDELLAEAESRGIAHAFRDAAELRRRVASA